MQSGNSGLCKGRRGPSVVLVHRMNWAFSEHDWLYYMMPGISHDAQVDSTLAQWIDDEIWNHHNVVLNLQWPRG